MNKVIVYSIVISVIVILGVNLLHKTEPLNFSQYELKQKYATKPTSSVDHSQFEVLQEEFKTPQDVTEACLTCHNKRHEEIIHSSHWNWERVAYVEGKGISKIGKKNVLNNFCIGSNSNEQACAKCHIGFGMTSNKFDFNNARNVDCMVCHDNSEEYIKGAAMAGYPDRSVNLTKVAQGVGRPSKINCGSCHFYSGGGNNVKHGDLEDALLSCDRNTDVHMAQNGINMSCVECHTAEKHQIKGKLYSVSSTDVNRLNCEDCHTSRPHLDDLLNRHYSRIACQTCHIPTYAKVNATKMAWKWSEAGKLLNGKPYHIEDSLGNHTYLSIKGAFEWKTNVEPDYVWFNGSAQHYVAGDKVESVPVQVNKLLGSVNDPHSKIYPVKIHRGDQIYDPETNMLIQPKLYSPNKGDSAFWMDFDWNLAAEAGMKRMGLPYSGKYDFIETEMYWPVNHMVAPKDQSLDCNACHTSDNGRLAGLNGFYIPGRDSNSWVDLFGKLMFWGSLLGVFIHALARFINSLRKNEVESEEISI
ncbi:tetrathionate reductase family octaheme c-type cytochrome [Plebeiibacterium sediminum]|uniref:Tetrathionate reductase family octaheme c-type cytochrome n=1 Tax=Plebeiibacterium sediminum TaxID=2992112 RepID=A0AAE3M9I2_9BACT|nr:tetrathionate reductase family octaheme c-type cytochrome [Plebeiobacterium sediminum]MCW3789320.1 tetrathionate reductase family octaheme c-type cytochrome [Plebeiobacterium sediminum]